MLADLFSATPAELKAMKVAKGPEKLPSLASKGLDPVKLATLQAIIEGDLENATALLAKIGKPVCEAGDEGPWIFAVPKPIVDGLAKMSPKDLQRIATEWSQTEEWEMEDWPKAVYKKWFGEVQAFAKKAQEAKRGVYLWLSL